MGSGKTWAGARKFVVLCCLNPLSNSLITAPTLGDINRVMIGELANVCADWNIHFDYRPNGGGGISYAHIKIGSTTTYVLSSEDPKRFAGFQVSHAWIDECARCKFNKNNPLMDTPTQVRSRIRCPEANIKQLILTTTPEGTDNWVQQQFIEQHLPHRAVYVGSSMKNSALSREYIDTLRSAFSEDLAKQYLEGYAVDFMGAIAHGHSFSSENIKDVEWDFSKVFIGCDFNVQPMCWVAGQMRGQDLYIMDEMVIPNNASVEEGVRQAHAKNWSNGGKRPILFIPDKSAKNRSTTGDTEFQALEKAAKECGWRFSGDVSGRNPQVNSRIALVSSMLKNHKGERRIFVHPRCAVLINELRKTKRLKDGAYDPGKDKDRGHILDALGYVVWNLFEEKQGVVFNNNYLKPK